MTAFSLRGDSEPSDLVRRAKAGEEAALAALYDAHAERLYRFGLARLGSPDAAEDLLQEVFVKVIEALPRYEERGLPFGAWLFRIARNTVIDRTRAAQPTADLDAALDLQDGGPGPAAIAELRADAALLRAALATLTSEQREVVRLRFFAGLSGAEIAAAMGRREGTIRALQFRALGALRRHLEAADPTRSSRATADVAGTATPSGDAR